MDTMLFYIISIVIIMISVFISKGRGLTAIVKFAYPNAKYNAMGNPYVLKEKIEPLLDSKNLQEFINILEKEYNLKEIKNIEEVEDTLKKVKASCFQDILNDSPKPIRNFFQTYFRKYEIDMIKGVLRSKLENEEIEKLHPFGNITEEIIYKMKEVKEAIEVIDLLDDYKYFDGSKIIENLNDILKSYDGNSLEIDNILDRYYFKKLREVEHKILRAFSKPFKQIINMQIDMTNIKILLRAKDINYEPEIFEKLIIGEGKDIANWKLKQLYLAENIGAIIEGLTDTPYKDPLKSAAQDYEKTNDIFVFEKALDSHLLRIGMELSLKHVLTSGPMIRFLISKEFEIRNLRTIARGIYERINGNDIKRLLILEESL